MGFFDWMTICGICGIKVGWYRWLVKRSNAWICPQCLKKAGGISKIDLRKHTIEELREFINQGGKKHYYSINKNPTILSEEDIRLSLPTAQHMYNYCVKNGFGSGWNEEWGVKHFKLIEDNLMNGEEVVMAFIGLEGFQHYAHVVTNKRIIRGQKNAISGENLHSISFENINDIKLDASLGRGLLIFDTIKETFYVGLDIQSAQKTYAKVLQVLDSIRNSKAQGFQSPNSPVSAADEIKQYKELLEIGVITQEEYELKKKQILVR